MIIFGLIVVIIIIIIIWNVQNRREGFGITYHLVDQKSYRALTNKARKYNQAYEKWLKSKPSVREIYNYSKITRKDLPDYVRDSTNEQNINNYWPYVKLYNKPMADFIENDGYIVNNRFIRNANSQSIVNGTSIINTRMYEEPRIL